MQAENTLKTIAATKKMTVIYLRKHDCSPKQKEDKPSKEELENILWVKPMKSPGQLQLDVVCEALLGGKGDEMNEIALKYSYANRRQTPPPPPNQPTQPDKTK